MRVVPASEPVAPSSFSFPAVRESASSAAHREPGFARTGTMRRAEQQGGQQRQPCEARDDDDHAAARSHPEQESYR